MDKVWGALRLKCQVYLFETSLYGLHYLKIFHFYKLYQPMASIKQKNVKIQVK